MQGDYFRVLMCYHITWKPWLTMASYCKLTDLLQRLVH